MGGGGGSLWIYSLENGMGDVPNEFHLLKDEMGGGGGVNLWISSPERWDGG